MKFTAAQIATGYGRLITSMDDVYLVMCHMTGQQLFTHQLPGALDASKASMLKQYPWLADIDELVDRALEYVDEGVFKDNKEAMEKVAKFLNTFKGTELELEPIRSA